MTKLLLALVASLFAIAAPAQAPQSAPAGTGTTAPPAKAGTSTKAITEAPKAEVSKDDAKKPDTKSKKSKKKPKRKITDPQPPK